MKHILFILVFTASIFTSKLLAQDFNSNKLDPIVRITKHSGMAGSGVVINTDDGVKILSCAHVFSLDETNSKVQVDFFNDKGYYYSYPATLIKKNDNYDLSLIKVNDKVNVDSIEIADIMPPVNSPCIVRGYVNNKMVKNQVFISGSVMTLTNDLLVKATGKGTQGLSGTPLLNNGKIVSIQSLGSDRVIIGCDISLIKKILQD